MKLRIYNKTLDPNLWLEGKKLNPEVKDALLKIAEDFYKSTDLKAEIQNILFLGSSANYNWTPTSDIDLHVVVDITDENITEDYARKFMDGLAFKWNSEHDIEIKGHPVELYLQDIGEPNATPQLAREGSAIYSIFDDQWMKEPNPQNIQIDADKVRNKFQSLKKKINTLIKTEDVEKLKELMKSIRNYRDAGLTEGGEFSVENIVFKALRHSGDIKKLKDTIGRVYDKARSLPEGGNIPPYKKTEPLKEIRKLKWTDYDIDEIFFPSKVIENVGNRPFLLVGVVGDKGADFDDEAKTHSEHGLTNGVRWRYNSNLNTLFWVVSKTPTEKQVDAVLDYLSRKLNISNPIQKRSLTGYNYGGHYIE